MITQYAKKLAEESYPNCDKLDWIEQVAYALGTWKDCLWVNGLNQKTFYTKQ